MPSGITRSRSASSYADGSGERVLTEPGDVEMQAFDWSRNGEAILGACRFSQSERYSTCLVPVVRREQDGDARVVRVIASDPQAQSLQPAILPGSALDHVPRARSVVRLDVDRLRRADDRRVLAGDHRRYVVRRQAAMGTRRTDRVFRVESLPASRMSGDDDSTTRRARRLASRSLSRRSDRRSSC